VRAALIRVTAVSVALAFAAPAAAQDPPPVAPPPPDDSAISQYVEGVPAAGGTKTPGVGRRGKPKALPTAVRAALNASGGSDAPALQQLATSPDLGAPARPAPRAAAVAAAAVARPSEEGSPPVAALSAAVTAAGDGGGGRFAVLGLALLAITAVVLASARRRVRAS
jgi:hypothetical protein